MICYIENDTMFYIKSSIKEVFDDFQNNVLREVIFQKKIEANLKNREIFSKQRFQVSTDSLFKLLDTIEMGLFFWSVLLCKSLTFAQSISLTQGQASFGQSSIRPTLSQSSRDLGDYDKWTSPNPSKPTDVFIRIQLRGVNSVDMAQELFDVDMSIQMRLALFC